MANIEKYLINKGIEYRKDSAGSRYFPDVDPVIFPSFLLCFDYSDDSTECRETVKTVELLERYCKRYGYRVYSRYGWYGTTTFKIAAAADLDKYNDYSHYERQSIQAVEKYIHIQKTFNLPVENDYIAGIMKFYAGEYKSFLAAVNS